MVITETPAPIFVGIGGDSGSGESTLSNAFYELFGCERITTVCVDDYHSLDRRERALVGLTPLNPRANNFALMEEQLWALKRGESISKPVYDHADGTFKPAERVDPNKTCDGRGRPLVARQRGDQKKKPVYDHADGTFKPAERVDPNKVVIIQG